MSEYFLLLGWLLVAHAVCDYPLQGDFLARAKNPAAPLPGVPWGWPMAAHCAIHGGAVWHFTGSPVLGLVEFFAHGAIDYAKCCGLISFSQDQVAHIMFKAAIALIAIGLIH